MKKKFIADHLRIDLQLLSIIKQILFAFGLIDWKVIIIAN